MFSLVVDSSLIRFLDYQLISCMSIAQIFLIVLDDIVLDETKDVLLEVRVLFGVLTTRVKILTSHLYCHLNGECC
jgi:hypothetical protein